MNISRRGFIRRGSMAAGAGVLLSHGGFALAEVPASRLASLSSHGLVQGLSQLGRRACIRGGCLAPSATNSTLPVVGLLVELPDLDAVQAFYESEAVNAQPQVIANGNTLYTESSGVFYVVEALLPEKYAERLSALKSGAVDFAHEALTGPVGGGTAVNDPLDALTDSDGDTIPIRLVATPDTGGLEAFALLIRAVIEQGCHSLDESEELAAFLRLLLQRLPLSEEEAGTIVAAVIGHIAVLARLLPEEDIRELLGSDLVARACEMVRSLPWETLESLFTQLRAQLPDRFTDGSIWLSILLCPELRNGIVLPQVVTDLELAETATREDLPLAREVLEHPAAGTVWQGMRNNAATYEDWCRICFGPATAGTAPHEDFDGDGTANAFEYGVGSDGADASDNGAVEGGRETVDGVTYVTLNYTEDRGKAGVRYEVQGTPSLTTPAWSPDGIEDVITGTDGDQVHHQGRVPVGGAIRYLRLSVFTK
jgi:hypothetical protein